jgi:ESS family glutamate:Na+ symporter
VLLLGEGLQRRVKILARFNIPVPVIGGLLVSLLVLALNGSSLLTLSFQTKVSAGGWTWLVTPEIEWAARPEKSVTLPLLVGFFTCIGLNATWRLVRQGSYQLLLFWGLSSLLGLLQNGIGIALARAMGESPLLGIICGSLTLLGGHGTALGFASTFVHAGFPAAATVGTAAATFGVVCGSLIGGPVATRIIQRHALTFPAGAGGAATEVVDGAEHGIFALMRTLAGHGRKAAGHLLLLAAVIKAGAWLSYFLQQTGLVFPGYMGAMLVGLLVRNACDLGGWSVIDSRLVDLIGTVLLRLFLAMVMTSLNLTELAATAGPMLVILVLQVAVVAIFARWVIFRLMGRDYEAAVMASGLCGFGLGATSNAVANMDSLVRRFGIAPRAFIIVPTVGGLLVDLTNSVMITSFLNFFKSG